MNARRGRSALLPLAVPFALLSSVLGVQVGCSDSGGQANSASSGGAAGASGALQHAGTGNTAAGAPDNAGGEKGSSSAAGMGAAGEAAAAGGGTGDAGAAGAAGDHSGGAAGADSGPPVTPYPCASDGAATSKPSFSSLCALAGQWAPGAAVPGASGEGKALIGVTPDELTIAWTDQSGSSPSFYVADRQTSSASFASSQIVSGGYVIGLSADGLRLVALTNDSSNLFEITRSDRTGTFDTQNGAAFALIDAAAAGAGTTFQDCVLSPDDHTVYYTTVAIGGGEGTLYSSSRSNQDPWPVGQAFSECEFQAHDIALRHPTGVSSDGLTLFYFDGVRGIARAAWRETASSPFTWFVDLPGMNTPQPNSACDQLYFSTASGGLELAAPR